MDVFYNLMHFLIQVHQSTSSYDPCIFGNQIITRSMNTYNAPNMSRPFVPKPDRWRLNRGSANHLTMILLESSEVPHFPPSMKYVIASLSWMLNVRLCCYWARCRGPPSAVVRSQLPGLTIADSHVYWAHNHFHSRQHLIAIQRPHQYDIGLLIKCV